MTKRFAIARGTRDVLPADIPQWQSIEKKARKVLSLYNYKEIRTPFFEETELLGQSVKTAYKAAQDWLERLPLQGEGERTQPKSGESGPTPESGSKPEDNQTK